METSSYLQVREPILYNGFPTEFGAVLANRSHLVSTYDLIIELFANVIAARNFFYWNYYRSR